MIPLSVRDLKSQSSKTNPNDQLVWFSKGIADSSVFTAAWLFGVSKLPKAWYLITDIIGLIGTGWSVYPRFADMKTTTGFLVTKIFINSSVKITMPQQESCISFTIDGTSQKHQLHPDKCYDDSGYMIYTGFMKRFLCQPFHR